MKLAPETAALLGRSADRVLMQFRLASSGRLGAMPHEQMRVIILAELNRAYLTGRIAGASSLTAFITNKLDTARAGRVEPHLSVAGELERFDAITKGDSDHA